jgi:hypothetical protein
MNCWLSLLLTDVGRDALRPHYYLGTHHFQLPNLILGQRGAKPDLQRFAVSHGCQRIRAILQTRPQHSLRSYQFQPLGTPHSVSRARKPCLQSSLSLLLSNLSSTNSKGSGPTRTPPEKGYSRTPIVKSTEEMIKANTATIRVCTSVFSKPNR